MNIKFNTKDSTKYIGQLCYVVDGVEYIRICEECIDCPNTDNSWSNCKCYNKITGESVDCPVFCTEGTIDSVSFHDKATWLAGLGDTTGSLSLANDLTSYPFDIHAYEMQSQPQVVMGTPETINTPLEYAQWMVSVGFIDNTGTTLTASNWIMPTDASLVFTSIFPTSNSGYPPVFTTTGDCAEGTIPYEKCGKDIEIIKTYKKCLSPTLSNITEQTFIGDSGQGAGGYLDWETALGGQTTTLDIPSPDGSTTSYIGTDYTAEHVGYLPMTALASLPRYSMSIETPAAQAGASASFSGFDGNGSNSNPNALLFSFNSPIGAMSFTALDLESEVVNAEVLLYDVAGVLLQTIPVVYSGTDTGGNEAHNIGFTRTNNDVGYVMIVVGTTLLQPVQNNNRLAVGDIRYSTYVEQVFTVVEVLVNNEFKCLVYDENKELVDIDPETLGSCEEEDNEDCGSFTGNCMCYGDLQSSSDYTYVDDDGNTDIGFSMNSTTLKWVIELGQEADADGTFPFIDDCLDNGGEATITITDKDGNIITFVAQSKLGVTSTNQHNYSGIGVGGFSGKVKEATIVCSSGSSLNSGKACQWMSCDNLTEKWFDGTRELTEEERDSLIECTIPVSIEPECGVKIIQLQACADEATPEVNLGDLILTIAKQDCNDVILSAVQYNITQGNSQLTEPVTTTTCDPQPDVVQTEECIIDKAKERWTEITIVQGSNITTLYINQDTLELDTPEGNPSEWVSCAEDLRNCTTTTAQGCYDGKTVLLSIETCTNPDYNPAECDEDSSGVNLLTNGPLEGNIGGGLPSGWTSVPNTSPISNASGVAQSTSDTTGLTGHNVTAGIAGTPYEGLTFVTGLAAVSGTSVYHEGLQQTVTGLVIGNTYCLDYHQSVVNQSNVISTTGGWKLYLDDTLATEVVGVETSTSDTTGTNLNLVWSPAQVCFTATATSHTIQLLPYTTDATALLGTRMGIDDVSLTEQTIVINPNCQCATIKCVTVIDTIPFTVEANDPLLSYVPCGTNDVQVDVETSSVPLCIDTGATTVVAFQVLENVFQNGTLLATNIYYIDINGEEITGTVVPNCNLFTSQELCSANFGTVVAVTISGTTTYYDSAANEITKDLGKLTIGQCSECCPNTSEYCACIDGVLTTVQYGVYPDTGNHVGWYRNTFTGESLEVAPEPTNCCGDCTSNTLCTQTGDSSCNTTATCTVFKDFSHKGGDTSLTTLNNVEIAGLDTICPALFPSSITGIEDGNGVQDVANDVNTNLESWINNNLGVLGFAAIPSPQVIPSTGGSENPGYMQLTYPTCAPWSFTVVNVPTSYDGLVPPYDSIRYTFDGTALTVDLLRGGLPVSPTYPTSGNYSNTIGLTIGC